MNVVFLRTSVRQFLPRMRVWSRLNISRSTKIYAFAATSFVLPASPLHLAKSKEILEETVVKCPVHSYMEPLRDQVEKLKEEVQPKSIIQSVVGFVRSFGSCVHMFFRAIQIVVIFTPAFVTSWILYFPKLRHYWYVLLVKTLQVGGSSFMKLGQWSATRPDIFPIDLCRELSKLHSTAKTVDFAEIREVLDRELGKSYKEVFDDFDTEPIGSGCIAQVYKARIKNTNEWVALKIKRPEVDRVFQCDLQLFNFFAKMVQYLPFMSYVNPTEGARLFSKTMAQQLDFRVEAINLVHFRDNYRDDDQFVFPLPYLNLSTSSLLVESYEPGTPLSELLSSPSQRGCEIAHLGILGFLHMLLVDNFLHADLHPGNILVRENVKCQIPHSKSICHLSFRKHDTHPQLVFLDCGLVNILEESQKQNFVDLFIAIAKGDGYEAGKLLIERAPQPSPPVIDPEGFMCDIRDLVNANMDNGVFNLTKMEIANALTHMMTSSLSHHVMIDSRFVNLFMSVIILEGVGRQLDPNLNIISAALPVISYSIPEYGDAALTAIRSSKLARKSLMVSVETYLRNQYRAHHYKSLENGKNQKKQGEQSQEVNTTENYSLTSIYERIDKGCTQLNSYSCLL